MHHTESKSAIVTGASRGIGRALALTLADMGYSLGLVSRSREGLQQTAEACHAKGVQTLCLPVDIQNREIQQSIIESTVDELGPLHALINNAGLYQGKPLEQTPPYILEQMMQVNAIAAMNLTRYALPHLINNQGAVIFISSIAGKMSIAGGTGYCASKHAIQGFAGGLFDEVKDRGVKVSTLCPGFVNTEMVAGKPLVAEHLIQPEDIAHTLRFVLEFPSNACPTEIVIRPQLNPYQEKS